MKFSKANSKLRNVEISMIPLIDLFMNILVFFIISTSFTQNKWMNLNLPKTLSGQNDVEDKVLAISMQNSGDLFLNKEKISLNKLIEKLETLGSKATPVLLGADKEVSHGKVMELLDTVKEKGFTNVGVLSQNK